MVKLVQQFALLAASLRSSSASKLYQSEVSFVHTGQSQFSLDVLDVQQIPETQVSCWHALFHGSVLARGFPIPLKPGPGQMSSFGHAAKSDCQTFQGIEIPYDVMTSLARVWYPVEFRGGIVLKGFSTMLVPTQHKDDSIQWHFMSNDGNKRLPVTAIEGDFCKINDPEVLREKRAFLGFCGKMKVLLGTQEADYQSICDSPFTITSKRRLELSGVMASLALTGHGLGPTISGNFVFSKNQAITRDLVSQDYVVMLEHMKERPMILYDVDAKKSWFVSTLSVVLHMMHILARRRPSLVTFQDDQIQIPFADASYDGGQAAWDAIFKNDRSLLELHAVPDGKPFKLMDLVKSIWANLESAIAKVEERRPSGIRFERPRTIRAFELMDIILSKPSSRLKEHCVESSGGGWELLTEDIITLCCSKLGDIMKPDVHQHQHFQMCSTWASIPPMEDYMLASAAALRYVSQDQCNAGADYVRLTDELRLYPRPKYVPCRPGAPYAALQCYFC